MASVEALWTIDFDSASGGWVNGGIAVLETGRVFGGDSRFYYLGTYAVAGPQITAKIEVRQYILGQHTTAWGDIAQAFQVTITGTILDPIPAPLIGGGPLPGTAPAGITGQMVRPGFPALAVRLVKRAELP